MLSVAFLLTLRMKRLWVPGFSLALILLPGLGFAETQQFRLFPEAKQIALPELSDGLGWKQPMYYSTIQTADIDGDGQSEVLARWIDGLSIYRFENGTLLRHSRILALSDNAGFYEPSWYSTIHTAVLITLRHRGFRCVDTAAPAHDRDWANASTAGRVWLGLCAKTLRQRLDCPCTLLGKGQNVTS